MDRTNPSVVGASTGVAAYVVGYLLVFVVSAGQVRDALSTTNAVIQFFGGDPIPTWQAVGWVFYDAHFVPIRYPALGGTATTNFISSSDLSPLLYAVPPVVLFAGGLAAARYVAALDASEGFRTGASAVFGYFVAVAVGVFVFAASRGGATIQPVPATALLVAGVVYPVVFGGLGGVVATALD